MDRTSFLALCLLICQVSKAENQLLDPGNCCQLELTSVIDEGNEKFIPRSAIAALSMNGMNVYYFVFNNGWDLGVINNTATGYALDFLGPYYKWTEGRVLSNPNDCVLGWNVRNGEVYLDTNELFYPRLDKRKEYFGRSGPYVGMTGNYHTIGTLPSFAGTDIRRGVFSRIQDMSTVQLLYVDCAASLKKLLSSELYHIELDRSALSFDKGKPEEVVSSTEVTNNSDEDQKMKIDIDAEIFSFLDMRHESKLQEISKTKWGVHGSGDLGWVGKILSMNFRPNGDYDTESAKENFTTTGRVVVQSRRNVYRFNQKIKVKARTRMQVLIKTKPIKGKTPFTAYYKISAKSSPSIWTDERILRSIRRTGFTDYEKIQKINGSLIIPIKGHLAVETGFETQAEIISTPLGSSFPEEVSKKLLAPVSYSVFPLDPIATLRTAEG